jgi:hypothetical protein
MTVASPIHYELEGSPARAFLSRPAPLSFAGLNVFNTSTLTSPFALRLPEHERVLDVVRYHPAGGAAGTRVTVELRFTSAVTRRLRLAVGRCPIATDVRPLPNAPGAWALEAVVPPLRTEDALAFGVLTFPLTVQAVNEHDVPVDSITFGQFTYTTLRTSPHASMLAVPTDICTTASPPLAVSPVVISPMPRALLRRSHTEDGNPGPSKRARTAAGVSRTPSPQTPELSPGAYTPGSSPGMSVAPLTPRRVHKPDARRVARPTPVKRPISASPLRRGAVRLMTALESLSADFDPQESAAGRRLVRFQRVVEAHETRVHATVVSQAAFNAAEDELNTGDSIILSCIERDNGAPPCVTSVDIIQLLEMIDGRTFEVEEKNRIRRNLEGLKPTTVAKHRFGCEDFFARIMEYPKPKPRNIEKDIKVFDWTSLPAALEKIISKKVRLLLPSCVRAVAYKLSQTLFVIEPSTSGTTTPSTVEPTLEFTSLIKAEPVDFNPQFYPQLSPGNDTSNSPPNLSPFFGSSPTQLSPIVDAYLHRAEYMLVPPMSGVFDMHLNPLPPVDAPWPLMDVDSNWSSQSIFDSTGIPSSMDNISLVEPEFVSI